MRGRHEEFEASEDYEGEPLIPKDAVSSDPGRVFVFDEDGRLTLMRPSIVPPITYKRPEITPAPIPEIIPIHPPVIEPIPYCRPCSLQTLNGSWLLSIKPTFPHFVSEIRGPMRIEANDNVLRMSGDIYAKLFTIRPLKPVPYDTPVLMDPEALNPIPAGTIMIYKNWYPAYPQREYRWYFRSTGATYGMGKLAFTFERHLWDTASEEFTKQDSGSMELNCCVSLIRLAGFPRPTIKMTGTASIGGKKYNVTATKTSPYYRGCLVEVDVMQNRSFPTTATSCDSSQTFTFAGVYRSHGVDFRVTEDEINIPDDPLLTTQEMHNLLASHRSLSAGGNNWHLWLLVGSRTDGTLGLMFDTGNPPHREGAVGFYDPTFPNWTTIESSAQGARLGEVPLAFLRTLIHEAGHAFNLFHPKNDIHGVAVGTTIMNQTGDVINFATTANPYPCNAAMEFNDHNHISLIHSPDPQVKPGWKEFGWGHGSVWSGIAEPVDVIGLDVGAPVAEGLRLDIDLPKEVHLGEFVLATVTATNIGNYPQAVTSALNLAEGDLRITVKNPSGCVKDVCDVVLACSDRRMVELQPGDSITGNLQLFYTNQGFTFEQPGHYIVQATLNVGDAVGSVVKSNSVGVYVRLATSAKEREILDLTFDKGVGLSLAFGDFGTDTAVMDKLTTLMERFGSIDTGAASAMVLANSLSRNFRDLRTSRVIRKEDPAAAEHALDVALSGREAVKVAKLTSAVVSPRETLAPLLDKAKDRLKKARKGTYAKEDLQQADKIFSDHLA